MKPNTTGLRTVKEIAKLRKISVAAVHKAIVNNRVDAERVGFIYLIHLNEKVYQLGK